MSMKNRCYTYFAIDGNFDPDDVCKFLNLTPDKCWRVGDCCNGTILTRASWEFGKCTNYDFAVGNQMRATIEPLLDKISLLNQIRMENDVSLTLVIVPEINEVEPTPSLAPPLDVIDFCHATRTEIDIDLYIFPSEGKSDE